MAIPSAEYYNSLSNKRIMDMPLAGIAIAKDFIDNKLF
jgi:hypothetical protein